MWNDYERLLVDALADWEDGLHTCGRHMSESLKLEGRPDPRYVVGARICLACKELDAHLAALAKGWEKAHKDNRHPERYTLHNVYLLEEAQQMIEAQQAQ